MKKNKKVGCFCPYCRYITFLDNDSIFLEEYVICSFCGSEFKNEYYLRGVSNG